jgi:hypothetical protein
MTWQNFIYKNFIYKLMYISKEFYTCRSYFTTIVFEIFYHFVSNYRLFRIEVSQTSNFECNLSASRLITSSSLIIKWNGLCDPLVQFIANLSVHSIRPKVNSLICWHGSFLVNLSSIFKKKFDFDSKIESKCANERYFEITDFEISLPTKISVARHNSIFISSVIHALYQKLTNYKFGLWYLYNT